jgi:phospholipase C
VKHVVILMQENRSFDHYFGTMPGVRGFGDRFPAPLAGGRTVWMQGNSGGGPPLIAPFPLNTRQTFEHMRVEGTPHSWADAQYAWDGGRMSRWPEHKKAHSMGYYEAGDLPFQWSIADAFTLCDAYHCSFQGGTNTNRLFLWTGMNDGAGAFGGPSISNSHDQLPKDGGAAEPYLWTTYPERLEAAGVSWKIYPDMADNFSDNPLVGFKAYRDSLAGAPGSNPALAAKGLSTQHLDVLQGDVLSGGLPAVSWVISPAADSEHPGPSSPAQGADYLSRVLDCLTANPEVWAKTVLLVMFDENDGFFDHVPPPAPPLRDETGAMLGGSTVDLAGEHHTVRAASEAKAEKDDLMGRPYGLGPRVPMYVISPWSRGGWVNSEVFDHTSVIRFLEARFGVAETNISPWRRAVCGDLTSCFDFKAPNATVAALPVTQETARRAAALGKRTTPPIPGEPVAPVQTAGVRPSRALAYDVRVEDAGGAGPLRLDLWNPGGLGVVLHAYDMLRMDAPPRRYTLHAGGRLADDWPTGPYDVWILGPNGYHWRFTGAGRGARVGVGVTSAGAPRVPELSVALQSNGQATNLVASEQGAGRAGETKRVTLDPRTPGRTLRWALLASRGWYDLQLSIPADPAWRVRLAGRVETGADSTSDPVMGGAAMVRWT